ncbi:beta-lactamase [Stenotrophomonas ginsengisoli]|uniref:Beta-lactamase n=1 Tax=Stenotrophomonas ginsengisoli TaxID=336566 RepID=A0A0R0DM36_9GAMM|nr:serine hydrolase domain-containing protein [Stenotrophomonas ginsengisoli]KRG78787.1 beta-lactamase [Stenotrophomonas ginsengisoli]
MLLACGNAVAAGLPEAVFHQWLAAFNSGDAQAQQQLISTYNMEGEQRPGFGLRQSMGPFSLLAVQASNDERVQALVRADDSERTLLVTLAMSGSKKPVVSLFQIEGAQTPPQFQPARLAMPALLDAAGKRLDGLLADDAVAGCVQLAKDGQTLFAWQGGLADRAGGVQMRADTQLRIASLGKMFTAVAVLQLVQAGQLSLDDPIAAHLPDYPGNAAARGISVRQLLNHTSGLGDVFGEDFSAHASTLRTHTDYIARYAAQQPQHAPGAEDGYSNYGYIVLGAIIEAVSGQSYYDYVQAHVFAPAGMTATGALPESEAVPGRAVGYAKFEGRWLPETVSLPWRGTAAGGGYSTAGDLLKFGQALLDGTLLDPALLQQATVAQNHKDWYGYGFMVSGIGPARQFGHEGGVPGQNAVFWVLPEAGYVLVGLSNTDPDAMGNAVNYIARRLPL